MLILKRSPQQEANLQKYLEDVQDPASSNYQRFLSPDEFGRGYGVSEKDIQILGHWLESHGFTVNKVNKGRTEVEFSGTAGLLKETFHTEIHRYQIGSEQHWANSTDPSIPAALESVVAGVASLNDFKPVPQLVQGPKAKWKWDEAQSKPDFTLLNGGTSYLFVGPGDAATIYDAPSIWNMHSTAEQPKYTGEGVTIAIVSDTGVVDPDAIYNYRSLFRLPAPHITYKYDGDPENLDPGGDDGEAQLDIQVSGAVAPDANIVLYSAGNTTFQSGLFLAIYRAIDDNTANILSVSFGACEAAQGVAGNRQILNAWEQAAAQGIAVTVSTGDSGSAGCDNFNTQRVASHGLAVNGLASTPYDVAVGGTDFDALKTSFSTYVGSANGHYMTSALKYIPERPWNNSTATNAALALNTPLKAADGSTNIVAGGGGASHLGTVDSKGAQVGYPKPLWQKNFPYSDKDLVRDLPDVSLFAGSGLYRAFWAVCGDGECTQSNPTISAVGGTSASAPAFAGALALLNQKIGAKQRLGQPNWILYKLAQRSPAVFHKIATGNNSVYCKAKSAGCGENSFLTGYNSGSGYNLATGLGSVDISQLIDEWDNVSRAETETSLALSKTSFTHGESIQIETTVSPAAASGEVAITNDAASKEKTISGPAETEVPLVVGSGEANYTQFPGGSYDVYANYSGDGGHAGSVSKPVHVTVGAEDSIVNLYVRAHNSKGQLIDINGKSVALGTRVFVSARPIGVSQKSSAHPASDATGSVYIYDSFNRNVGELMGNSPLDSSGIAEVQTSTLAVGTHSVVADYGGDWSYNPSSSTGPISFSVSKAHSSVLLTASAITIASGNILLNGDVRAELPANSFQIYGKVTFLDKTNQAVLGVSNPTIQCRNVSELCNIAPLTIDPDQLAMGPNIIETSFSGDSNFLASSSGAITITCTAGCSNGTGQTLDLAFYPWSPAGPLYPGGVTNTPVLIGSGGGFSGEVNLTCSVTASSTSELNIPTCGVNPSQVKVTPQSGGTSSLVLTTTALVNGVGGTTPGTYTVTFHAADAATGTVTAEDYFNFNVSQPQ